jgi:hypothetical protein
VIPRKRIWDKIAPAIMPVANRAPRTVVAGNRINTEAISSITPVPILPQGSIWSVVKIYTDSEAALNLKKSDCSIMRAASMRSNQGRSFSKREAIAVFLSKDV